MRAVEELSRKVFWAPIALSSVPSRLVREVLERLEGFDLSRKERDAGLLRFNVLCATEGLEG